MIVFYPPVNEFSDYHIENIPDQSDPPGFYWYWSHAHVTIHNGRFYLSNPYNRYKDVFDDNEQRILRQALNKPMDFWYE